jgi:uncharacterized protein
MAKPPMNDPVPSLPQDSVGRPHGTVVPTSRKPSLAWDDTIPRFWLHGSAMATHLFNGLNLLFPYGERFFIRAVLDHQSQIRDPLLLAQIRGFVTQEGVHAHEHDRYFDFMRTTGYRIDGFRGKFRWFMKILSRFPAPLRLSMTAAAEHYTATLGGLALEDEFIVHDLHPTLRRLIIWHATEEIEHKAVAFDVLQATHPSYLLRMAGFFIATVALLGWALAGTRMLLRQDRVDRKTIRAQRREVLSRNQSELPRTVWNRLRDYLRRDFHPNDIGDLALAHRRMAEVGLGEAPAASEAGA